MLGVTVVCVALAGCGLGPGQSSGGATSLTITRDYGTGVVLQSTVKRLPAAETVMRMLDRSAHVATRYGGRYVQSINGISGNSAGSPRRDWFFYVNGIESSVGAAEADVHPGDRVWWDYRDWEAAMRVPAVVGSWPEPFAHGSGGKTFPVRIDCLGPDRGCRTVVDRLDAEGVPAAIGLARARVGKETLRLLVGPWANVREDRAAAQLERGPDRTGVFATFERGPRGYDLLLRDRTGRGRRRLGAGAGLIAAVRYGGEQPTWVVTGTDQAGADAALRLLRTSVLRDRYAVASDPGRDGRPVPIPLP